MLHGNAADDAARLLRRHIAARSGENFLARGAQQRDIAHDDLARDGEFFRQRGGADRRVRRVQHVGNGLSPLVRMHSLFLPFSRKSAKFRLRFVL